MLGRLPGTRLNLNKHLKKEQESFNLERLSAPKPISGPSVKCGPLPWNSPPALLPASPAPLIPGLPKFPLQGASSDHAPPRGPLSPFPVAFLNHIPVGQPTFFLTCCMPVNLASCIQADLLEDMVPAYTYFAHPTHCKVSGCFI